MKKIIKFLLSFLLLCLIGCESTKQTEETEIEVDTSSYKNNIIDNSAKNEESNIKNYTGWIGINDDSGIVKKQIGNIEIKGLRRYGTFNIYAVNKKSNSKKSKAVPVFSTNDEFAATSFYLLVGKKIYKLFGESDVEAFVRDTKNGVTIDYMIKDVAEVHIDFTIFKSDSDHNADMIKVTSTVKSLLKNAETFGLKLVLDTVWGEKSKVHFYDSNNLPIKFETMYKDSQIPKWIVSKNNSLALQMLFQGADISPVDFIAVANYETLNTTAWEPNMNSPKNFNTMFSYGNSAIDINWKKDFFYANEEKSYVFYLAFATNSDFPNGETFITQYMSDGKILTEETNLKTNSTSVVSPVPSSVVLPVVVDVTQNDFSDVESEKSDVFANDSDLQKKIDILYSSDELDANAISKDKLSFEYIQKILKRIDSIKDDDPEVNKEELLMLSNELDVILENLRMQ